MQKSSLLFQRLDASSDPSIITSLVELERQCFSTPWGQEQYTAAFAQSSFLAFGLYYETRLVAYISLYHTLDEMEILNIAVWPELRRQGAGYFLLAHAMAEGQKLGGQRVFLEVRVSNVPARALYEKVGFELAGKRKKYYADTGEDACVYVLALEGFSMLLL